MLKKLISACIVSLAGCAGGAYATNATKNVLCVRSVDMLQTLKKLDFNYKLGFESSDGLVIVFENSKEYVVVEIVKDALVSCILATGKKDIEL